MNNQLSDDAQATLAWLDEVCGAAFKEARNHNLSLMSRLARNDATQFYMHNVMGTNTVTREQFARQYPAYMAEATRLHADYLTEVAVKEMVPQVNTIESQLAELKVMFEAQAAELAALKEASTPAAPKKKPAKPSAETAPDEAEEDAESEA